MINILIIDDNHSNSERLNTLLNKTLKIEYQTTILNNFEDAATYFNSQKKFDILFLDIEIGDKNGFDLIPFIKHHEYSLIVTTGHIEYAISAIRNSAIDFLLKPIIEGELTTAVNKALLKEDTKVKIENLLSNISTSTPQEKTILLKSNNSLQAYKIKDIIRCQADVNYTLVYLNNGSKIIISKTLKDVDKTLANEGFFRIHKSHLINLNYLKKYITDTNEIILQDGSSLPLSMGRKDLFIKSFLKL